MFGLNITIIIIAKLKGTNVGGATTVLPRLVLRRTIKLMSFLIKKTINFEQFLEIFGIF